ncbi:MAG: hypothetical protein ACLTYN_11250 [Dysosmobacter welbionis]
MSVTRRYYRSGGNTTSTASLSGWDDGLFLDTGMGREGYSIISQARLMRSSPPERGRREIFERPPAFQDSATGRREAGGAGADGGGSGPINDKSPSWSFRWALRQSGEGQEVSGAPG